MVVLVPVAGLASARSAQITLRSPGTEWKCFLHWALDTISHTECSSSMSCFANMQYHKGGQRCWQWQTYSVWQARQSLVLCFICVRDMNTLLFDFCVCERLNCYTISLSQSLVQLSANVKLTISKKVSMQPSTKLSSLQPVFMFLHWPVLCVLTGSHCDKRRGILHGVKVLSILIFITRLFFARPLTPCSCNTYTFVSPDRHPAELGTPSHSGELLLYKFQEREVDNHMPMAINQGK